MDINSWPKFVVFTVVAVLLQLLLLKAGSKLVERLTGRHWEPEHPIYFAVVVFIITLMITLLATPLVSEKLVYKVSVGFIAMIAAFLVAQSMFGKKRTP